MPITPGETLLCVPTPMELELLSSLAPDVVLEAGWAGVEVIGFGPVAAAARTAQRIAHHRARAVVLTGIAGTYDGDVAIGTALAFDSVALDGVGAGEGEAFLSPTDVGFSQWSGDDSSAPVERSIELVRPEERRPHTPSSLVTVCAAADGDAMVARRRRAFPYASAEDMEGFGFALAAHLAGVPATIVRGISNVAGNRDAATWQVTDALAAAGELLRECLP